MAETEALGTGSTTGMGNQLFWDMDVQYTMSGNGTKQGRSKVAKKGVQEFFTKAECKLYCKKDTREVEGD